MDVFDSNRHTKQAGEKLQLLFRTTADGVDEGDSEKILIARHIFRYLMASSPSSLSKALRCLADGIEHQPSHNRGAGV